MENIGKLFTGIILIILTFLIDGFVVMKMWQWILVPTFEVKTLLFSESVGISLIISFMKPVIKEKDSDFNKMFENFLLRIIYALLMFFIAFIISLFI